MFKRHIRPGAVAILMLAALCGPVGSAAANPVPLAYVQAATGTPTFYLDLTNFSFGVINTPNSLPGVDPFSLSAPIEYTQLQPGPIGPIPGYFQMTPLALTGSLNSTTFTYGAGSFALGLDGGGFSFPWLEGSFSTALLSLQVDLTGLIANLDATALSGSGLTFGGLNNPGSFVFAFGNPQFVLGQTGAPEFVTFELSEGIIAASVPDAGSTLLLLSGGLSALMAVRSRARRRIRG